VISVGNNRLLNVCMSMSDTNIRALGTFSLIMVDLWSYALESIP
jgi:hypothetical protein